MKESPNTIYDNVQNYLKNDDGIPENETLPLPQYQPVPELATTSDYNLIAMYKIKRSEKAIMCLAHRYEGLAYKTLAVMSSNWEFNDRKQQAFITLIETIMRINLSKINPLNYPRCLYSWYKQGLLNAIRSYRRQLGDVRESVDENGDKCIIQYVGFDEEIHTATIGRDETGLAMEKLDMWSLLDEDEAHVVEMYISGVSIREQSKRTTLYRLLNNAKQKIANYYRENGITLNI